MEVLLEGRAFDLRKWRHGQRLEVHRGEFAYQGGDEAKFKEINEAYDILRDPEKRDVYDRVPPTPTHPHTRAFTTAPLYWPTGAIRCSHHHVFGS